MWGKAISVIYTEKIDQNTLFWVQFEIKDVGAHKNSARSGVPSQSNDFTAAVCRGVPALCNTLW